MCDGMSDIDVVAGRKKRNKKNRRKLRNRKWNKGKGKKYERMKMVNGCANQVGI